MTTATETITNTGTGYDGNADDLAQRINDAHCAGLVVHVNGRRVFTYPGGTTPARVYDNGTLSVTVQGRTKGKVGTIYVKAGQSVAIQIGW